MEIKESPEENFDRVRDKEHLLSDVSPIEIHVTTFEDLRNNREDSPFDIDNLSASADIVDFDPNKEFIISRVDDHNKFTGGLANCTSVVVVGTEQSTGRNISLETHQSDPSFDETDQFRSDLIKSLEEIKKRCVEGTIDAVIAGGSFAHPVREKAYKNTVTNLDQIIRSFLSFEPYVATGPKIDLSNDELIYCDTNNRAVYIIRSKVQEDSISKGYKPSELDRQSAVWLKDRDEPSRGDKN